MMPRNVSTRWNSLYEMCTFAFKYRKAIDLLTRERDMNLRDYELDEEEWKLVGQLRDALKVRLCLHLALPRI